MTKDDFEAFWNAVKTGDLTEYSDLEMAFMHIDTSDDGLLDAAELEAFVTGGLEFYDIDNAGDYLLCEYNGNPSLDIDLFAVLFSDVEN